ncbi:MAG TPA: hypothetical protein VEJ87_07405 [Acidimicrobiales bacterium]|nr:hypothetical protein [Acidimicrobiales bacterium]
MTRGTRDHGKFRWLLSTLVVALGFGVCMFPATQTVGASGTPAAGDYEAYIFGSTTPSPMDLLSNHTVTFPPASLSMQWSVHGPEVRISGSLGEAPPEICLNFGQGEGCDYFAVYRGRKTSEGIASQAHPGEAIGLVGNAVAETGTFWAVRTSSG